MEGCPVMAGLLMNEEGLPRIGEAPEAAKPSSPTVPPGTATVRPCAPPIPGNEGIEGSCSPSCEGTVNE